MRTVNLRFYGLGLALAFVLAAMLTFAATAQAQTPVDDQYGSPTGDSSVIGGAEGGVATSTSAESSSGEDEGSTGGVLPSTGGAPIYLGLAGVILVGTSVTLWLRLRAE